MCVLIFSTTFIWNISHSKNKSARYFHKHEKRCHVKYSLFLSDFNENWIFSTDFRGGGGGKTGRGGGGEAWI